MVSIFVPDDYPIIQLKRALDWDEIKSVMNTHWRENGKNVDGGRGLPWPTDLYAPLLVLKWVKGYHSRQMEEYLIESVVARLFLELLEEASLIQIRDHSSIDRAEISLGVEGKAAVNALIIKTAEKLNFTNRKLVSSDTTVQEPAIGYPNEPGILKGWADRIKRSLNRLKGRGVKGVKEGMEKVKEIYTNVKKYFLFAKTKEEKDEMLSELVKQSEELIEQTKEVIEQIGKGCSQLKQKAAEKLRRMVEVAEKLIPQIKHWMKTGRVAKEKIIHVGITEARSIVKGAKERVKFGMKWLINRLPGGYLFGKRVEPRADENKMPEEGLKHFRELFGEKETPEMVVYDRGASAPAAAKVLKAEGVQKVGIHPRGQGKWMVGKKDQRIVKSERGKTEGSIGRLKSRKYGFSHRQERSVKTQDAAGQKAIVSVNLNTLMRDLVEQAKSVASAQC
ncbi:MAG: hypothetical protein J2P21_16790 [Chloracidobacterium sp.]|nr:hypothetical protein [Chloracidobacterium sp.]